MQIILLISGVIIGGFISWFTTHQYYQKASTEQKEVIGKLSKELKEVNTLKYFEVLLEQSRWKKIINHKEIWISQKNNTFQIHQSDYMGEFTEPWTTVYTSQPAKRYNVYLKIGNAIVKELSFVSLDGGRIFVPITERDCVDNNFIFYWDMKSLSVKVCNVIGSYYIYNNIFGVAGMSNVEIRNNSDN